VFDLSITKLLVLAVIALVVFGPKDLPKIAAQAGRALRDLRRIADNAKADLKEGLGPEFADFDIDDLNPKRFVQKHLFDDLDTPAVPATAATAVVNGSTPSVNGSASTGHESASSASTLPAGEQPPFDLEAT
jgi:sec-independent protein translocase protein TatB